MRALAVVISAALMLGRANARTEPLRDSISPDHSYELRVSERGERHHITYDIVRRDDGHVLLQVESSYQPEESSGESAISESDVHWPWEMTTEAEIHGTSDSRYVAIDEQVHNYIGQVLIVSLGRGHASQVLLPEKQILARTRLHWDRERIRVRDGFSASHVLTLWLAGHVVKAALPDGRNSYEHRAFEIDLQVRKHGATIKRCVRAETDQTMQPENVRVGQSKAYPSSNFRPGTGKAF